MSLPALPSLLAIAAMQRALDGAGVATGRRSLSQRLLLGAAAAGAGSSASPGWLSGLVQPGTSSDELRARVLAAVEIQRRRFGANSTVTNGRMTSRLLRKHAVLDKEGERILRQAVGELGLSARAHDKVLRVARAIADLAGEENIGATHLSEAIQYRRLDRGL